VVCATSVTNSRFKSDPIGEDALQLVDLTKKQNQYKYLPKLSTQLDKKKDRYLPDAASPAAIQHPANQAIFERYLNKIRRAREVADIVIAFPHVGGQYNPAPGIYTRYVVEESSAAGASLVVANHPHVPLRAGVDKNGVFCAYSLGNLAFMPGIDTFRHNTLAEYSILLHAWFDDESHRLRRVTFNVLTCRVDKDDITRVVPLYDLYRDAPNATARQRLMIDNEAVVARVCCRIPQDVLPEYEIYVS